MFQAKACQQMLHKLGFDAPLFAGRSAQAANRWERSPWSSNSCGNLSTHQPGKTAGHTPSPSMPKWRINSSNWRCNKWIYINGSCGWKSRLWKLGIIWRYCWWKKSCTTWDRLGGRGKTKARLACDVISVFLTMISLDSAQLWDLFRMETDHSNQQSGFHFTSKRGGNWLLFWRGLSRRFEVN